MLKEIQGRAVGLYQKICLRVSAWEGHNKLLEMEWVRIWDQRQKIPAFLEKCGSEENAEGREFQQLENRMVNLEVMLNCHKSTLKCCI